MQELKSIARGLLLKEKHASIQATGLVLTALRRQKGKQQNWEEVTWANRRQLFGRVYSAMRRALVDHARRRNAAKRDVNRTESLSFEPMLERFEADQDEKIDALNSALEYLERNDSDLALLIQHRYFCDMTFHQISEFAEISEKTARRKIKRAHLILQRMIRHSLGESKSSPSL